MARISLAQFILERLAEAGELTLEALFPQNRVEGRLWRQVLGLPVDYRFSPRTFSATLSRLKRQGLVGNARRERRYVWSLTARGKGRSGHRQAEISLPKPDGIPRLVVFDVPEAERHKRYRIRTELISCGYERLQKSVWLGYAPLPKEFIHLLDDLKLKGKVHIMKVSNLGTLEDV